MSISADGKTLLVILGNHLLKRFDRQRYTSTVGDRDKVVNLSPAIFIKCKTILLGLMTRQPSQGGCMAVRAWMKQVRTVIRLRRATATQPPSELLVRFRVL